MTPTPLHPRERGAGLLSMVVGVLMFFVLLTFTVQVMFNLYTTSVVTGLFVSTSPSWATRWLPTSSGRRNS